MEPELSLQCKPHSQRRSSLLQIPTCAIQIFLDFLRESDKFPTTYPVPHGYKAKALSDTVTR